MKKIFSILLAAAATLCTVACTENTSEEASLSVNPTRIEFTAENAAATNVTVTATGTGWSVSVTETGSGWLTAEKIDDKTVTVTAANNTTAEQRIGGVIITPDNEDVGKKEITVVQAGSENPVVYDLQLSSSLLEFEPESAEAQTVTVTVSGDMGWKAEAAEGCAEWVTVTAAADSFTVKVGDNPDTKERIGSVVVTPDNESVEPKEVTIKQKPKVIPASISADVTELTFKATDYPKFITVTAVNCEYEITTEDENGEKPEWLHVTRQVGELYESIRIGVDNNTEKTERKAFAVITSDNDAVEALRIPVTQEAAEDPSGGLDENIDITNTISNNSVTITPRNDWEDDNLYTYWEFKFWGDGIIYSTATWPPYSGTGDCMDLIVYSTKVEFNDEMIYALPEGTYTVTAQEYGLEQPLTISSSASTIGSYYYHYESSVNTNTISIVSGTMKVEHNGENHVLTIKFKDDKGNEMTGTYTGKLNIVQAGVPRPNPGTGGGEEGPVDPGFGQE